MLTARARILDGLIQNAHVEELVGQPGDAPAYATRARQFCVEAVALAQSTQNKRVLVNAHIGLGEVAANEFFRDYDLARRCVDSAAALIEAEDADYVMDELNALKAKLLKTLGIDGTLRGWSQGIVGGKSLQEVLEDFAELVVTQMWPARGSEDFTCRQAAGNVAKKNAAFGQACGIRGGWRGWGAEAVADG